MNVPAFFTLFFTLFRLYISRAVHRGRCCCFTRKKTRASVAGVEMEARQSFLPQGQGREYAAAPSQGRTVVPNAATVQEIKQLLRTYAPEKLVNVDMVLAKW